MPDFDDPFKPSDATVMRPRPGAGRRGSPDAATPMTGMRSPAPRGAATRANSRRGVRVSRHRTESTAARSEPAAAARRSTARDVVGSGSRRTPASRARRDPAIRTARAGLGHHDGSHRRRALRAVRRLDEAVLSTPWGAQSEWAQQTLLVALHREAWGGEKFFEMLDKISRDPERHIDLMELQYLCIALGFAGKYRRCRRGSRGSPTSSSALYRKIRDIRGTPRRRAVAAWKGVEDRRNPLIRYVPWWVVGAAALAVLAVTFVIYYARLGRAAAPVHADAVADGPRRLSRSRDPLRRWLAPRSRSCSHPRSRTAACSVEEDGGSTRITLLGQQSVRVRQRDGQRSVNEQTLRRVAAALDQVPGRVLVVGHTDDQPIQSLRYRDNFDLSRERAVSVAKILQKRIDDAGAHRVEWRRVDRSRASPPEAIAANRARNRRVEIVHVRG